MQGKWYKNKLLIRSAILAFLIGGIGAAGVSTGDVDLSAFADQLASVISELLNGSVAP